MILNETKNGCKNERTLLSTYAIHNIPGKPRVLCDKIFYKFIWFGILLREGILFKRNTAYKPMRKWNRSLSK